MAIHITVNGAVQEVEARLTLAALLLLLEIREGRVAIEVNGEIVPNSQHSSHKLANNDVIEIVRAIGGG